MEWDNGAWLKDEKKRNEYTVYDGMEAYGGKIIQHPQYNNFKYSNLNDFYNAEVKPILKNMEGRDRKTIQSRLDSTFNNLSYDQYYDLYSDPNKSPIVLANKNAGRFAVFMEDKNGEGQFNIKDGGVRYFSTIEQAEEQLIKNYKKSLEVTYKIKQGDQYITKTFPTQADYEKYVSDTNFQNQKQSHNKSLLFKFDEYVKQVNGFDKTKYDKDYKALEKKIFASDIIENPNLFDNAQYLKDLDINGDEFAQMLAMGLIHDDKDGLERVLDMAKSIFGDDMLDRSYYLDLSESKKSPEAIDAEVAILEKAIELSYNLTMGKKRLKIDEIHQVIKNYNKPKDKEFANLMVEAERFVANNSSWFDFLSSDEQLAGRDYKDIVVEVAKRMTKTEDGADIATIINGNKVSPLRWMHKTEPSKFAQLYLNEDTDKGGFVSLNSEIVNQFMPELIKEYQEENDFFTAQDFMLWLKNHPDELYSKNDDSDSEYSLYEIISLIGQKHKMNSVTQNAMYSNILDVHPNNLLGFESKKLSHDAFNQFEPLLQQGKNQVRIKKGSHQWLDGMVIQNPTAVINYIQASIAYNENNKFKGDAKQKYSFANDGMISDIIQRLNEVYGTMNPEGEPWDWLNLEPVYHPAFYDIVGTVDRRLTTPMEIQLKNEAFDSIRNPDAGTPSQEEE